MQQLNPSEISELIKSKIQNLALSADVRTQGTVVSVTDGICRIHGLSDVMAGRNARIPRATPSAWRSTSSATRSARWFWASTSTSPKATRSSAPAAFWKCRSARNCIGRVVNSLGQPIDGKGPINAKMTDVIEKVAPGVIARNRCRSRCRPA